MQRMLLRLDELDSRTSSIQQPPPQKHIPATPADGLEGDEEEDDPPSGFPAKSPGHAAFVDPRDWIDYLPWAYAESMPPVGLTNPGLWNPRNDEWDRYLTGEKKHATRDEYRYLLCYGVFTAAAHACGAHGRCGNDSREERHRTARATPRTPKTYSTPRFARSRRAGRLLNRLAYLRRFKCIKALTGEERVAERLLYSRFFDTTPAERSSNGVDSLLNVMDDKRLEVSIHLTAKAQAAAQFKGSGSGGSGGGSGGNIRIKEQERAEHADRATKERADKNKDKDKIQGKPGNPARKTTTPQTEEQN
eukprot:jgi/Tetstr1/432495/TSEL_021869.t1